MRGNVSKNQNGAPDWGYDVLRRAIDAAGVSLWKWNVETDEFSMDDRGYELWEVTPRPDLSFAHLSAKIHPADRDRVSAAFAATRATVGSYEIDFRTKSGPYVRWISARGQGDDAGIVNNVVTGIFLDITDRKQAEEGHELLAGEMSHRVKNLLAIATSLTRITSRSSSSIEDMTKQLMNRLTALDRAHDLVRPLPGDEGRSALLGDIFTVLLAPYDDEEEFAGRIRVAVPRLGVGQVTATALALVVHELATNSVKYGSLSLEGTLDVSGSMEGENVRIVWAEQGGPEVASPPDLTGFGSKLVRKTIEGQLGGSLSYEWSKSGALVTMLISSEQISN
ncbi:MAG: histidine kinase [Hoeflea sp.]|uniref:sensor histidine kinase n=1 Tax=Hoeflea sp. TaxID=1940281 RepID=UPI001D93D1CA|nr:sensor histidine kinase [Hoeflea sp.]MBU4527698.1 histidine kinase [Alphaproteobacteria bacterium]MBU4546434.1 histidine kinase [Alphaproteobacteria bacterium]MBU4553048.1 histidine kinase [Alphaproteobacteria bacterium]MBV1724120.1 histidine kinase [Hoeflea sp.]MBV1759805.1 histidine kinase [Hoeflea sp.]